MDQSPKILIIEDHQEIRDMLSVAFSNEGFMVDTAGDGHEGLEKAVEGGYAIIICDLKMPHKDGIQFLRELQALDTPAPNGPAVVYSSADYAYTRSEAEKYGAVGFFVKDSTEPLELVNQIKQMIASQPTQ